MHACAQDTKTWLLTLKHWNQWEIENWKMMRIINNDVTKMSFKKTVWWSTHVFVQMDSSEDYKFSDEVKPAYWNFTLVTIDPTTIYFKQNNSLVQQGERFCRLFLWCRQKNALTNLRKLIMMVKKCNNFHVTWLVIKFENSVLSHYSKEKREASEFHKNF